MTSYLFTAYDAIPVVTLREQRKTHKTHESSSIRRSYHEGGAHHRRGRAVHFYISFSMTSQYNGEDPESQARWIAIYHKPPPSPPPPVTRSRGAHKHATFSLQEPLLNLIHADYILPLMYLTLHLTICLPAVQPWAHKHFTFSRHEPLLNLLHINFTFYASHLTPHYLSTTSATISYFLRRPKTSFYDRGTNYDALRAISCCHHLIQ